MKPIELQSVVMIRGEKICLYGLTSGGGKLLDAYSRDEALVIGNELIEAALKVQRKRGRPIGT